MIRQEVVREVVGLGEETPSSVPTAPDMRQLRKLHPQFHQILANFFPPASFFRDLTIPPVDPQARVGTMEKEIFKQLVYSWMRDSMIYPEAHPLSPGQTAILFSGIRSLSPHGALIDLSADVPAVTALFEYKLNLKRDKGNTVAQLQKMKDFISRSKGQVYVPKRPTITSRGEYVIDRFKMAPGASVVLITPKNVSCQEYAPYAVTLNTPFPSTFVTDVLKTTVVEALRRENRTGAQGKI